MAEAHASAERLEVRAKSLAAELDLRSGLGRAIGHSPEWTTVLKQATQVAATETTALVQGESGTGKEVVARFIHRASPRKDGPFVAINCAALPEQLLESELFGFERGAFTGAQQSKVGQIELASNGVLFLDEITEMSLTAQAKFLRVLQEREFQRLGGTRHDQGERAGDCRDKPRSAEGGGAGRVSRRPVLPVAGLRDRHSAAAGSEERRAAAGRCLPAGHRPFVRSSAGGPDSRREACVARLQLARQRRASCATRSNGPRSCARAA